MAPAVVTRRRDAVTRLLLLGVAVALLAGACGPRSGAPAGAGGQPRPAVGAVRTAALAPVRHPSAPRFRGGAALIGPRTRARMRWSWRPGCPAGLGDLRRLLVDHWGFDGRVHRGELVVHRRHAQRILRVLAELFRGRFPIQRMRLVDAYRADDDRSMAANNTSAFNCRRVSGTSRWSEHAYGRAIDLNPVQNPYVTRGGRVSPPAGRSYVNRARRAAGMVHAGDPVVRAFAAVGWGWGGTWRSARDYQHFSSTGR
jgi:D-alanyl-D-alanine carboxypeptidase